MPEKTLQEYKESFLERNRTTDSGRVTPESCNNSNSGRSISTDRSVKECYNCTIKTTEASNRVESNRGFAGTERIRNIRRKRSFGTIVRDDIAYRNKRYEDRDVATNTVATAGILIQPATQSIQSVKRLFVVFFEPQFVF